MPFAPPAHSLELIHLPAGHKAPGPHWIRVTVLASGASLTGSLPDRPGSLSAYCWHRDAVEAEEAGIGLAREHGVGRLYVEG